MSQFNESAPQQPARKNNSIIYWVVILVLLAGCIYLFMSKNQMAEEHKTAETEQQQRLDSVSTDRASLQTDYDAASAKIDQLVSQNAKMDSALQGDRNEIAKLQSKIKAILSNKNATAAELKSAREMITNLTDKSQQLEMRIAELEKENAQLTATNKTVTHERDSTAQKNVEIKKVGSVLHASNIRMEPIHKRRNGKEKETSKAKKVDVLRITFDIDENRIAESGSKQIYVRILSPNGTALSNPANSSGMLTTSTGGSLNFSVVKNISLTQNQPVKDVTIDWNQDGDYAKGNYTIEIYNEGYKVGSGSVTLK